MFVMSKQERAYSSEFVDYQNFIISHPAYAGMPMPEVKKNNIPWVSPAASVLGAARTAWWNSKKVDLIKRGLLTQDSKISDVARLIHPTKIKPCQTCGKFLSIEYVYLNSNAIKKISDVFPNAHLDLFTTLEELLESINDQYHAKGLLEFVNLFHLQLRSISISEIAREFITHKSTLLSPGVMSNAPDRFDGFHSYNKCCRSKEDKGRSKENLMKYGEDRRAYENWADGDWKAASWLMKEFSKHGVSADHIGPISLGFCHTTFFTPMTRQENSAKNNRLRFEDVKKLLTLEKEGHQIVSWHTKNIWDRLKLEVKDDVDALELSKVLRKHLHRVLLVLHELKIKGHVDFLKTLLNPSYAFYSIKINGFDYKTGDYREIVKTQGNMTQYSRNAARYINIAFDSLDQYESKDNRKLADIPEADLFAIISKTELAIRTKNYQDAKKILQDALGGV